MSVLRKASTIVKRIPIGDEGDWIEVHEEISKRDRNHLFGLMPYRPGMEEVGLTPQEGLAFQTDLFVALVTDWSLAEPVTAEAYLDLDPKGTDLIDSALATHFEAMMPKSAEVGKA